jgi:hypothetical protein
LPATSRDDFLRFRVNFRAFFDKLEITADFKLQVLPERFDHEEREAIPFD